MKKRKNTQRQAHQPRNIQIRSVRRDPPDIDKLSRALLALAIEAAQAEKEAQAEMAAKEASNGQS